MTAVGETACHLVHDPAAHLREADFGLLRDQREIDVVERQRTPFAPKFSGTVFADVTLPVTDGIDLIGGASVFWSEKFFAENTLDPFVAQGAYSRFDARIGIAGSDSNW